MHTDIINCFIELGYTDSDGLCHGLAIRWIEACILNEEDIFLRRIDKIITQGGIKLKHDLTHIKEKNALHPNTKKLELLDIIAFFDSLAIFQTPDEYATVYEKGLIMQTDITLVSSLASSNNMLALGGLSCIYSESGIYNVEEIKNYLDELTLIVASLNIPSEETLGFLFSSAEHALALTYSKKIGWRFMDSNLYPPQTANTEKLAQLITEGFFLPESISSLTFTTKLITTGNNPNTRKIKESFNQLKQMHALTEEKGCRDAYPSSLAFVYVINNNLPALQQLIQLKGNLNASGPSGTTPAIAAAEFGYVAIIRELAKNDADLNSATDDGITPAYIAAQNGFFEVIAELANYKVDFNKPTNEGKTPVFAAAQYGHAKVIAELAKHQINLHQPISSGMTPAFVAARNGHLEVIIELQRHHVDFTLSFTSYAHKLRDFVSTKDEGVKARAEAFLAQQSPKERATINIQPYDIAVIMGHTEIAEKIKAYLNKSSKNSFRNYSFYSQSLETNVDVDIAPRNQPK